MDFVLRTFRGEGGGGVTQTPHKRVNFHRINPLEEGVAPAIQVPRPCSQLKCHKRSGSNKKAIQV